MFNHIHQHESSVSRTKPGNSFIHVSGTQMFLLGYDKTASLGDGFCPSNSAGQTTHNLETWPYQAPGPGICLWLMQIISGVQGPTQILDEEGGEKLWKKRTPEKPCCSESNKGLLIQAKRAARFELFLNYQETWGKRMPFLCRSGREGITSKLCQTKINSREFAWGF